MEEVSPAAIQAPCKCRETDKGCQNQFEARQLPHRLSSCRTVAVKDRYVVNGAHERDYPRPIEESEQLGPIKWIADHERKLFRAIWLPRRENLRDWRTISELIEIARSRSPAHFPTRRTPSTIRLLGALRSPHSWKEQVPGEPLG
jgi:hypothetical protein